MIFSTLSTFTKSWQLLLAPAILVSLVLAPDNMYVYERKDYSKSSDADKTFDQL